MTRPASGAAPAPAPPTETTSAAVAVAAGQGDLHWRIEVSTGVLLVAAATEGLAAILFSASIDRPGWLPLVTAAVALLTLVVAVRPGTPHALRAGVVLLGIWSADLVSLSRFGFTANGSAVLVALVVVATVLLGARWGFGALLLGAASLVAIGLAQRAGLLQRLPDWAAVTDSTRPDVLVRIPLVFAFVAGLTALTVAYVLARAEGLLAGQQAALEALRVEKEEHLAAQAQLAQQALAARKAQELEGLGRLAGTAAHDFNNALTVVAGALAVLREQPGLDPAGREAVEDLASAAAQAGATAAQLRVLGSTAPRPPRPVALGPLLERAAGVLRRVLPPDQEVVVELVDQGVVLADEGQLLRGLTNLAFNARDAMPSGGRLTLGLRVAQAEGRRQAVITVADTGTGMDEEVQRRLFEPYFTTKGERGTGLGLASVRQVAEQAGGSVEVRSLPGQGTTVSIRWPLAEAVTASSQEPRPEPV